MSGCVVYHVSLSLSVLVRGNRVQSQTDTLHSSAVKFTFQTPFPMLVEPTVTNPVVVMCTAILSDVTDMHRPRRVFFRSSNIQSVSEQTILNNGVRSHTNTHVHTHTHTHVHTHVHIPTYTHTHTYIHTYIHIYIHTYIHTCLGGRMVSVADK